MGSCSSSKHSSNIASVQNRFFSHLYRQCIRTANPRIINPMCTHLFAAIIRSSPKLCPLLTAYHIMHVTKVLETYHVQSLWSRANMTRHICQVFLMRCSLVTCSIQQVTQQTQVPFN